MIYLTIRLPIQLCSTVVETDIEDIIELPEIEIDTGVGTNNTNTTPGVEIEK